MFTDFIEFECLDVREWLCVSQARNRVNYSARTCANDHVRSAELTPCSVAKCDLQSSRSDEAAGATNEFRSGLFVIVEVQFVQARYHPALTVTDGRHIDRDAISSDAELFTSADVRCNLRTVNNVLARQTGNVGTRSPMYLRSITATRCPCAAKVHAAI